ncbi:hypothetical protein ACFQJ7_14655 [Halovenus rubra]|uniref:Uncharacterized protein n=2 Tax=Halovenus rubra TaxID=869890 RepID=A0ABD5XBG2_9EURY|nr:hypothetical protein [Halovenus rubra]
MVVSDISEHREKVSVWDQLRGQLSRYDLLLAAIALLLGLGMGLAVVLSVPGYVAIGGSALINALLVADALYLNPPVDSEVNEQTKALKAKSVVSHASDQTASE